MKREFRLSSRREFFGQTAGREIGRHAARMVINGLEAVFDVLKEDESPVAKLARPLFHEFGDGHY